MKKLEFKKSSLGASELSNEDVKNPTNSKTAPTGFWRSISKIIALQKQAPPLQRSDRSEPVPLSFLQENLWLLDRLQPGNCFYNIPIALRLTGTLDAIALEQSFNEILRRHEILRSRVTTRDGQPVQIIQPSVDFKLAVTNLRELPRGDREIRALQLATEEAQRPFDTSQAPLLRAALLQLSEEEHFLIITAHYIIFDGWSEGIFFRELSLLYEAFCAGKPSPLPELPLQYADFASWQRQWLTEDALASQLEDWKPQLSGKEPALQLPTDRPRPTVSSFRGATRSLQISKSLAESLKELSRLEGVTLFATLLAAFQILLYRYTDRDDFLVGTLAANRNRSETKDLIGLFVNTLALRADLSGDPSFRELLARANEAVSAAQARQDLPFEKVIKELHPNRERGDAPQLQVMFLFQNFPHQLPSFPKLSVSSLEMHNGTAMLDLKLELSEKPEGISGWFEYSTDLFDETTIARMAGHFQTLLERIVANPEESISRLPLLTEAERHQLLVEWNETRREYPSACVCELFEEQVLRSPDAVAVQIELETGEIAFLTYRELNAKANQLARYLIDCGVGADVLVGICAERSLDMAVGLLGILKAGGAYVPLDPAYPPERLACMLEDSAVPVLLTQQRLRSRLPESRARVICLDADGESIARHSPENLPLQATGDNLAYVIYTSGSTGKPKGVTVEHHSLANYTQTACLEYGIGAGDRVLQFASINFDASAEEIYPALIAGATLVLRTDSMLSSLSTFLQKSQEWGITVLDLPTAYWHEIAANLSTEIETFPPALRLVIIGGEKALPERLAAWRSFAGNRVRLVNTYGPTEATIVSTTCELSEENAADLKVRGLPIGRAIRNAQTYILDRRGQPVPIGVPGELLIGGAGVARGYLNRSDLTAEKFIPNPFTGQTNEKDRLYKTGDLVRYLPDGNIEFLGRIDNQVKIRGFRIELGEIESALSQHPAVLQAAVVVREDIPGDKRLVAYAVARQKEASSLASQSAKFESELRNFVKQKLPDYMVPNAFVLLEAMPVLPNGKLDRRSLPAPDYDKSDRAIPFAAPRTPIEEIVASIWSALLHVKSPSIHDNFFELGGHSLLATQLIFRLRRQLGAEISLPELFQKPTVAGIAESIESALNAKVQAPPLLACDRSQPLPLSFAQMRLWFFEQLEPGTATYNIPTVLRLSGAIDAAILERSLNEIVRRHEALRTTFAAAGGEPFQVVAPSLRLTVPVVDLRDLPGSDRAVEAERLVEEEAHKPFDLTKSPLLRAKLLRLSEEEHLFLLTMHHIISDGWSIEVLLREVWVIYEAFRRGERSPLTELPVQYADFAAWQRQWLTGEVLESQLSYWKQQLSGELPVLDLPIDKPRPAVQNYRGASESVMLPANLSESLKALSRDCGVTLFMTLLAAFQTLLYRYCGQEDIIIGSPIAGRNRAEIEDLIGFFVNTVVLRSHLADAATFREVLHRAREVALGACAHPDLPFDKLVEELQPERHLGRNPIFQVWFNMLRENRDRAERSGLTVEVMRSPQVSAKFDLTLTAVESPEGLSLELSYNTDLFEAATIARMLSQLQNLLADIARDLDKPIVRLSLLSEAETDELLAHFNAPLEEEF